MTTLREFFVKLNMAGNAGKESKKIGAGLADLKAGLDLVVGAFSKAAGVIRSFTTELADSGDRIAKSAKNLGITAEAFQELDFAAKLSGQDSQAVQVAIQRMQKGLNDARRNGTGPFADSLDQLGVEISEFEGLAPDQVFQRLAGHISELEDDTTRAALAQDLFGRGGKTLIPLLNEGADGIQAMRDEFKKLGGGFTNDGAKKAEEFVDSQLRLKTVLESIKFTIGEELFPILQDMLDSIREWAEENRELIKQKLGDFIRDVINRARQLAPLFKQVLDVTAKLVPLFFKAGESLAKLVVSLGPDGLVTGLKVATAAMVGFKLATTAALGPVGLIAGAFIALLPVAIELGDKLGDVAFGITDVGREAKKLERQAGGRRQKRGRAEFIQPELAEDFRFVQGRIRELEERTSGLNVTTSDAQELRALQRELAQLVEKNDRRAKTRRGVREGAANFDRALGEGFAAAGAEGFTDVLETQNKRTAAANRLRKRFAKSSRGGNPAKARRARQLAELVEVGDITPAEAEARLASVRGRRGGGSRKVARDNRVSDAELLKIISRASSTGQSLDSLLGGRSIEGTTPPVITVTVTNNTIEVGGIQAPVTVSGVPGEIAEDVARMVESKQRDIFERALREAVEDIEPAIAR